MESYTNIQIDKYINGLKLSYKELTTPEKKYKDWQLTMEGFESDTDVPNAVSLGEKPDQILKTLEWLMTKAKEIIKIIPSEVD